MFTTETTTEDLPAGVTEFTVWLVLELAGKKRFVGYESEYMITDMDSTELVKELSDKLSNRFVRSLTEMMEA